MPQGFIILWHLGECQTTEELSAIGGLEETAPRVIDVRLLRSARITTACMHGSPLPR